jgi:O-antigen ligase
MISSAQPQFRRPTLAGISLFCVLAFCCLVDSPIKLRYVGTSGLGIGTFAIAGAMWAIFFLRPVLPRHVLQCILFLLFFQLYDASTMLWASTGMDGIQLLTVGIAFLGLMVVCARETSLDPRAGHQIARMLLATSVISVLLYWWIIYSDKKLGGAADDLIAPRSFALFALIVVAVALSRWRGRHHSKVAAFVPLAWAVIVTFTVALSMSRTALVSCAALFPLSIFLRLDKKSFALGTAVLLIGGAMFVTAIFSYQPLYDRFFAFDASMKVGGVAFNASGRTQIWDLLLRNVRDDWPFGKGVASSEILVRNHFNKKGYEIAQPHNDYLRFYYDTGVVGLGLWLIFASGFFIRTFSNLRRSIRNQSDDYPLHVAALLAFAAVSWSMLTDNSVCYSFVMMPLAIVMGCSLGAEGFSRMRT